MVAMEALGIPLGAHLKTGPMPTENLQLCANNADVEEVIINKNTVNIGYKKTLPKKEDWYIDILWISEDDDAWISGNKCKGRVLAQVFAGNLGKSLDTAKNECATACNMREDCHFASLTWQTKWQHCDLHGKLQEGYCKEFNDHWMWHLYVKKQDNVSL